MAALDAPSILPPAPVIGTINADTGRGQHPILAKVGADLPYARSALKTERAGRQAYLPVRRDREAEARARTDHQIA